jgi:hypothetical protein
MSLGHFRRRFKSWSQKKKLVATGVQNSIKQQIHVKIKIKIRYKCTHTHMNAQKEQLLKAGDFKTAKPVYTRAKFLVLV